MRRHSFMLVASMVLLIATNGIAQNRDDAITPLINQDTLIVMRGDLARINPNACLEWLAQQGQGLNAADVEMLRQSWRPAYDKGGGMLAEARDAGVKRAYWVLTLRNLVDRRGTWAFPIEGQTSADKVMDIVRSRKLETQKVSDLVIGAAPGLAIKTGPGGALPQAWAKALEAGQDAPLRIAVVPTLALRKSFEENLPTLTLPARPVPITTLTRGIGWLGISIWLPPKPRVQMVVQSPDAAAAQALADLVNQSIPDMRKENRNILPLPTPAALADLVMPTVAGDQLRFEPDFQKLVMQRIDLEVKMAVRRQSASNMKQILQGFWLYANNHNGQTPPDLNSLIKEFGIPPQVLTDPLNPNQKVGFIYIRPLGDWQKSPESVVLYEATPNGNNIGYADGHVEWWPTHEQVLEQAKAAEERNRAVGEHK